MTGGETDVIKVEQEWIGEEKRKTRVEGKLLGGSWRDRLWVIERREFISEKESEKCREN